MSVSLPAEREPSVPMTPREIVEELDRHVVGQAAAKRAVAVALRNRWRRLGIEEPLRSEITPKNILMIGPTGVGKTEIARRLARLVGAPFLKIEATKFTEVGYVGRDVESIVRDLVETALNAERTAARTRAASSAHARAEQRVLAALRTATAAEAGAAELSERERRTRLRRGEYDEILIEIDLATTAPGLEFPQVPGLEEFSQQFTSLLRTLGPGAGPTRRRLRVAEALPLLEEEELRAEEEKGDLTRRALGRVEQEGIVFLDEIDKIARRAGSGEGHGPDVSREGVQRDLLPLVEGTTVVTRHGPVRTDHILFIASGAFHVARPADLVPELQGRFPIRVTLDPLGEDDFVRILAGTEHALTRQYRALLAREGVDLVFTEDGLRRIAALAVAVNRRTEDIGARRLHTLLERLLEDVSFRAPDLGRTTVTVDAAYAAERLSALAEDTDLSRYIL